MTQVRSELASSSYQKAYATYQKKVADTQRVDELLNLGLLAFEAGDYETSFRVLAEAERLAEERETKSLSREAAGIAISDRVRAYQGTVFDKAMLHYYRGLGFLAQNSLESATVEGRRIATYLEVNARESKHAYKDDAFLQYFSGSLYDAFGQFNDAWISYKRAREMYADFYGVPEPSFLCPVTLAAVRKVGHEESEKELEERCGGDAPNREWGRVIVICEAGLSPPILEENIMFPIYKSDPKRWDKDEDRDEYAWRVSERRYHQDDNVTVDYFLRVALPYYSSEYVGTSVQNVVVRDTAGGEFPCELTTRLAAILRQDLSDRMPAIVARAISRALIKYAATKAAEQVGGKKDKWLGDVLGAAVNIAGAASEAADTRSWETLPDRIFVADFRLPPGPHTLRAVLRDDFGTVLFRHDFDPVEVKRGQVTFLRARCMR
ncbi:hypothetical protein KKH27_04030 [bacterium]|nr:hypothetical protein [bacterium]MBU1984643.1 hypothetical protein [bacterium]